MYQMYKVLHDIVHPETRAVMMRAGTIVSAARVNAMRARAGVDSTPDLLTAGTLTQAPLYPGNKNFYDLSRYYADMIVYNSQA